MTKRTEQMTGTATFIKQRNGNGDGRVYRLDPPLDVRDDWDDDEKVTATFEYVWVSAADVPYSGPETYVFGCDENGDVLDWGEQRGSYRGGLDHEEALRGAGYKVSA